MKILILGGHAATCQCGGPEIFLAGRRIRRYGNLLLVCIRPNKRTAESKRSTSLAHVAKFVCMRMHISHACQVAHGSEVTPGISAESPSDFVYMYLGSNIPDARCLPPTALPHATRRPHVHACASPMQAGPRMAVRNRRSVTSGDAVLLVC